MRNFSKLILFSFLFFTFVTGSLLFKISSAKADVDAIPEPFVPCTDKGNEGWDDPEFNSQRPYQASPCGDAPKAAFCNNDYIIEEKVSTQWTNACDRENLTCPYNGRVMNKDYTIYVNDVQLPILGNTQNVANSVNATDEFDDAQKVNEYLSWYLSGTTQKAEYGNDSISKTVDYSGPLKKLLPSAIQEFQRFAVLHKAGAEQEYTDSEDMEGSPRDEDSGQDGVQVKETFNHNQIVVCTTRNLRVFGFSINNPWVGQEIPTPCYGSGGSGVASVTSGASGVAGGIAGNAVGNATGSVGGKSAGKVYRMIDWWEGKSADLLDSTKVLERWNPSDRWGYNIPPFPWQFTNDMHYQKAYREWRGHECLIVLGKLICADLKIPGVAELHTNIWADFYQYIPLGTTADKSGGHKIEGVNVQGLGKTVAGPPQGANGDRAEGTYFVEQNPTLYYPHTQSTYDMLSILNKSHTSSEVGGSIGTSGGGSDFEKGLCQVVDVRSNEGDDLTFDNTAVQDKQKVFVRDVQIQVTEIGCDGEVQQWFDQCGEIPNPVSSIPKCQSYPSCDGTVQVVIRSTPKIPYADQIWEQSTVGQESAFRKIFPKIEEGAPVSCIADIPGVSDTTYNTDANLVNVDTPGGKKSATDAQLYFPHLGTVYEYFLNGIQTALRPKGYGEPIASGTLCSDTTGGDCSFDVNRATAAVQAAAAKYNIPAELLLTIFRLESGPYIADPSSYQCSTENGAGAIGIGQIKRATYNIVTCDREKLQNDIGMCTSSRDGKLSRCNFNEAAELMARTLLFSAGKWMYGPNLCEATGGLSLSNKDEWYKATCNYGTGFEPNTVTVNYQNAIPENERPIGRDMNYCDVVCHMMGQCPSYPNLP